MKGFVNGGYIDDTMTLTRVSLESGIFGLDGNDTISVNDSRVKLAVSGEKGNDVININNNSVVEWDVCGDAGDDTITINGGSVEGNIDGGTGNDKYIISAIGSNEKYTIYQCSTNEDDIDTLVINAKRGEFSFSGWYNSGYPLTLTNKSLGTIIEIDGWTYCPLSNIQFTDVTLDMSQIEVAADLSN